MLALSPAATANLEAFLVLAAAGLALLLTLIAWVAWARLRTPKTGLLALALTVWLAKAVWMAALFLRDYPQENTLIALSSSADLVVLLLLYLSVLRPS